MKFYGQAESAANRIISAFQSSDIPKALAPVFIRRNDDKPCRAWSWNNQFITALAGTDDARGFRQWLDVGRAVRKGSKAFYILAPVTVKTKGVASESGNESSGSGDEKTGRVALVGFRATPVFRIEETDIGDETVWAKHAAQDQAAERFLSTLPLRAVADHWGLSVKSYSGRAGGALGKFRPGAGVIAIGVENWATWAHELIHAADHRLGTLTERGQHWASETVAELGAATILYACGYEREADIGGAWDYIGKYSADAKIPAVRACLNVLNRTCKAVALILETADSLSAPSAPAETASNSPQADAA